MYIPEKGVLKNSNLYFHTPSTVAKAIFFNIICAGEFFCNKDYRVERKTYNSYLIMYIRKGKGFILDNKRTIEVKTDDVVIINCHEPHLYYTDTGWEILWVHFDGNSSKEFYNYIYSHYGIVHGMNGSSIIPYLLSTIIKGFEHDKPLPEGLMSSYINRILTELIMSSSDYSKYSSNNTNPILDAITYIHSNFNRKVTVEEIASSVNISPYYFSRLFKKETGYTPYEYVIKTRIDHGKILLKKTKLTIKQIAFNVGFNSESNFVNIFSKRVNFTPNEFRNTPL